MLLSKVFFYLNFLFKLCILLSEVYFLLGVDESPLITWGEIEGTPIRLDGGDTPLRPGAGTASFRIAEPPKRERLALALAEKASERHRNKKSKAMEAAKRLAS